MAQPVQPLTNPIRFFNNSEEADITYTFSIIVSRYRGRWIWVRHKERETWELPAGHVEPGESPLEAARRELYEETGALDFTIGPVVSYQGIFEGRIVFGMIFLAEIIELGILPDYEIRETKLFTELPEALTYPAIQPAFFRYVDGYLKGNSGISILS